MGLFKSDLYRSFAIGFVLGAAALVATLRQSCRRSRRARSPPRPVTRRAAGADPRRAARGLPATRHRRRDAPCIAPAATRQPSEAGRPQDRDLRRRLLLGRRGRVQPRQGRDQRGFGLSRRQRAPTPPTNGVGSGDTGHAEAVRVTYDPAVVRYDQLLRIFFSVVADPTSANRQGPDTGHAVPHRAGAAERRAARGRRGLSRAAEGASGVWAKPIVTADRGRPRVLSRPRPITRTSCRRTPTTATSGRGTRPRWRRCKRDVSRRSTSATLHRAG